MPPKAKITKDMILEAAFEIVKTEGIENLNVRNIAKRLKCSTQPILYNFGTIEEIKKEIYTKADNYHSAYISDIKGRYKSPFLEIGMLYIKFSYEEKYLFRFLFQSDKFNLKTIDELISEEALSPILEILMQSVKVDKAQAKEIFAAVFLLVHGIGSMLANNSMIYDENYIIQILENTFLSRVNFMKEG